MFVIDTLEPITEDTVSRNACCSSNPKCGGFCKTAVAGCGTGVQLFHQKGRSTESGPRECSKKDWRWKSGERKKQRRSVWVIGADDHYGAV